MTRLQYNGDPTVNSRSIIINRVPNHDHCSKGIKVNADKVDHYLTSTMINSIFFLAA